MKKTKTIVAILVALSIAIALVSSAAAQPPPIPADYSGTVTIGGIPAPNGTTVQAKCDTYTSGTVTTTGGKYSFLIVGPPTAAFTGKTVIFLVNGIQANETSTFEQGTSKTVNLTVAAAPAPTPTVTPVPPTPTLVPGAPTPTPVPVATPTPAPPTPTATPRPYVPPPPPPPPPTATPIPPTPTPKPVPVKLPPTGDPYGIAMTWFALGGAGAALIGFSLLRRGR